MDTDRPPSRGNPLRRLGARIVSAVHHGRVWKLRIADYYFSNRHAGTLGIVFNRAAAIEIGGFDQSSYPSADYFFFSEYVYRFCGYQINERLAIYRYGHNESMRNDVMIEWVRQSYRFRRYLAQFVLKSPFLMALAAPLTATQMRCSKRWWGGSFNSAEVMSELRISPLFNSFIVERCVRLVTGFRDFMRAL